MKSLAIYALATAFMWWLVYSCSQSGMLGVINGFFLFLMWVGGSIAFLINKSQTK